MAIRPRPPANLHFSQFSPTDYPALQTAVPLTASRLTIERALLMVGYPSRLSAINHVGPWRAVLLSALVQGYLEPASLGTSEYFRNLEPSERAATSFLLGQAFTYWCAQQHMSLQILVHVAGAQASWTPVAAGAAPKAGAGPMKQKSAPDFIGLGPGEFHVFESKGRSLPTDSKTRPATVRDACMPGALAQASRIRHVLSSAPKTRTAALWVFKDHRPTGYVTDPASSEYCDLSFDPMLALRKAYGPVLDPAFRASARPAGDDTVAVQFANRSFGVDQRLLAMFDELPRQGREAAHKVLSYLVDHRKAYLEANTPQRSFGPEGVFVAESGDGLDVPTFVTVGGGRPTAPVEGA